MSLKSAPQLNKIVTAILEASGAPRNTAEQVATSLVKSNLVGHDSHGVIQITQFVKRIKNGRTKPRAKMKIVRETPSTALVDGNWGFGPVIAKNCMRIAIEKARKTSISSVGIFNCNHVGRLGEYSMMATEQNMIGMIFCNSSLKSGIVAPYGGVARRLSTNPLSVAVPAGEMKPFLLDFATSAVALGKLRLKLQREEKIPLEWILNKDGNPSEDPEDFYEGGSLLPFGKHKGYALAILVDILAGALTGTGCSEAYEGPLIGPGSSKAFEGGNGTFILVINIDSFVPIKAFKEMVDESFRRIKKTPTMQGFKEVLIPGEIEFNVEKKRLKEGIFVEKKTLKELSKLAENLGLDVEKLGIKGY